MRGLVTLALFSCVIACRAQRVEEDGGGRDVSVALFSSQPARSVVIAAAGPDAWWTRCATCPHQPFLSALRMPAERELFAGGSLTVRDEEHAQARSATGRWHLRAEDSGFVDVVLTLPSERYVAAVLMGETAEGDSPEYLRAMAVVARTFVLRLPPGKSAAGRLASDVCDSTACQAMKFAPVPATVSEAVRSTAGETLWFGLQRAQVFFSGSCGGMTESAGAVWPKLAGASYLRSLADPYCIRKDRAAWHAEVPIASVQEIAKRESWRMPARIASAEVTARTSSERARTLVFTGEGKEAAVSASALRLAVGRSLGWNLLRSDAYTLRVRDGILVFDGHGHGHGVGLCQQGAMEMARAGKPYREILAFYFPGTTTRVTRSDEGWTRGSVDGIRFVSTTRVSPRLIMAAAENWRLAKSRFAPQQPVEPVVTFAPTTEIFRQMTSQPGWQLASTSGMSIVLQPDTVIAANHASPEKILLHEMLHVCVESGANANSPLWLREGLVEVLAGDAGDEKHAAPSLSARETDRLLRNAGSWRQSQAAHAAAGARARLLVERYGISAVRGWLTAASPVPGV